MVECVTIFSAQIAKSWEGGIGYQVLVDFWHLGGFLDISPALVAGLAIIVETKKVS